MSGDHNQYQKDKSYLDGMDRYKQVRELVKDPSLRIKDIVELTGYDKGHVSRLRKASQQFECPRCGHCCQSLVDADDTSQKRVDEIVKTEHDKQIEIAQAYERGWNAALAQQEPVAWMHTTGTGHVYFRKKPQDKVFNPQPVYTAPPKREWVGLTDEEVYQCEQLAAIRYQRHKYSVRGQIITPADGLEWHFAQAIEAKLKEKNT
jgi:hypothetical protein